MPALMEPLLHECAPADELVRRLGLLYLDDFYCLIQVC